ncbi:LPS biosynthesis protein WbpP [Candidatus Kaiserbacteria bacterium CG10_big_fil_rev_8_21_14_0_10_59_10]|uniref:LPS biosynthesis protein WbpP n=1 Tax=Candidatus Kaiserbacteria bacterium CG10_big_fil_rev_8_21_14_0_10_59_10 TaxID=1974612 RepID=A0A2H0U8K5_9BACT|nr:MAG: LPS biosynthesis protein WbpP [Candidatus Kaiserbacteria bacterium CG10_big_fil_rev_8_21_14_0_10_59_10]
MAHEKAVVTGGAGFVGSHLVDALVERGFDVHVVDNYAAGKREDRIHKAATYHEVDIRDYEKLAPVVAGARYVFHEAALPRVQFSIEEPLETFSVNAHGTASVLRAAHEGGVKRVIYAASSSAYGDQETLPLTEDLPASPKSPYGLQKYIGELMCRMWSEVYGLETVSLRYFNVYGPRFDPHGPYALVMGKFILQKSEGKPLTIWGDGTHTRDYTHVRDIVRANVLAAESERVGKGEVINIGAGENISVSDLAALIGGPVVHEPERLEPAHTLADISRAKELLGWEPTVNREEAILEMKREFGVS